MTPLVLPEGAMANPILLGMPWVPSNSGMNHRVFVHPTTGAAMFAGGAFPEKDAGRRIERCLFHGNTIEHSDEFMGFSPLYSSASPDDFACAANVIDAGGRDGHLSSVWLVGWGGASCYGFYSPKAPVVGLAVVDWRYVVRIANIAANATEREIYALLVRAAELPPAEREGVSFTLYCGEAFADRLPDDFRGIPVQSTAALDEPESQVASLGDL